MSCSKLNVIGEGKGIAIADVVVGVVCDLAFIAVFTVVGFSGNTFV